MHPRMYIFYVLKYALFISIKSKRYVNKQSTGVNIMKSINIALFIKIIKNF